MIDNTTFTGHRPDDNSTSERISSAISALASLSNVSPEQAALQAATVLTALAGPRAGLVTLGGEIQPVGISMLSVGGDTPEQLRLVNLLFSPLRYLQDDLHDYSLRVSATTAERMATRFTNRRQYPEVELRVLDGAAHEQADRDHLLLQAERSINALSLSHPLDRHEKFLNEEKFNMTGGAEFFFDAIPEQRTLLPSHGARCLREPTVFLDCPPAGLIHHGLLQSDRQSPLVLDAQGTLIAAAFQPTGVHARQALESIVVHSVTTRALNGNGLGDLVQSRGTLFSVTTRRNLDRLSGSPYAGQLLSRLLLAEVTPAAGTGETPCPDGPALESGYTRYRRAVQEVLRLRRLDASGISPILDPVAAQRFHQAQHRFIEQINELPGEQRVHAAKFIHLPATLLWALHYLCPDTKYADLVPAALHLAVSAMAVHLRLAGNTQANAAHEQLERLAEEMLRKLATVEPCSLRDLMRKYGVQRKSLHKPVLDHLVKTGRLVLSESRLVLSDKARLELLDVPPA